MLTSFKGANEASSSGEESSHSITSVTNYFLTTEVSLNTATLHEKSEYSEEEGRVQYCYKKQEDLSVCPSHHQIF